MKTVVIYDDTDVDLQFFVLQGDYSHLNHVYININDNEGELSDLIYEDDGRVKVAMLDEFPAKAVKDGAIVIVAGFTN